MQNLEKKLFLSLKNYIVTLFWYCLAGKGLPAIFKWILKRGDTKTIDHSAWLLPVMDERLYNGDLYAVGWGDPNKTNRVAEGV